ncbi:MAG: hypothetical protein OJF58_003978 [Enhydrobacter sp.]|nr:MAG: hypothetical protein OJF58_003978 [Enhydrobacter sp.]
MMLLSATRRSARFGFEERVARRCCLRDLWNCSSEAKAGCSPASKSRIAVHTEYSSY